jgi:hypothetical protein
MRIRLFTLVLLSVPLAASPGCGVQRTLQVESDPPGALVYLNGDEVGRTPMRKNFLWYGTYDVELRKEGYETLVKPAQVWAPWWQIPPIDFLAELVPVPLEDRHTVEYRLTPLGIEHSDPDAILKRAVATRGKLRGSRYQQGADGDARPKKESARAPAAAPTTQPAR